MTVSVPNEAITAGPHVAWDHADGPLMTWAGHSHWLTLGERVRLFLLLTTIDALAAKHWPHLARRREYLKDAP